jgi:hypothetical protein
MHTSRSSLERQAPPRGFVHPGRRWVPDRREQVDIAEGAEKREDAEKSGDDD